MHVTEFHYHSVSQEECGDWIPHHKAGSKEVRLGGWNLRDGNDSNVLVIPDPALPVGGYLMLCQDLLQFRRIHPAVSACGKDFLLGLGNGGDSIGLQDPGAVPALAFSDGALWPAAADGSRSTVQLIDPAHWRSSTVVGGSPGWPDP